MGYDIIRVVEKLLNKYRFELFEDHHHPGSGRYGVIVKFSEDISVVLPYLNVVLDDTYYDQENHILIGANKMQRYAFRPHEIQVGAITDASTASYIVSEAVDLVNQVWQERNRITPSIRERKLPTTYSIFRLLPRVNCEKLCGYSSCLAFAADLRTGKVQLEQCPLISTPEYKNNRRRIIMIFAG